MDKLDNLLLQELVRRIKSLELEVQDIKQSYSTTDEGVEEEK